MSQEVKTNNEVFEPAAVKNASNSFLPYWASIIANLSAFAIGISTNVYVLPWYGIRLSHSYQLFKISAILGAATAWYVCDSWGPKRGIQVTAFPLFTSRLVMAYCRTVYGYYAAELLAGFAAGTIHVATLIYAFEIAETKRRGSTVLVQGIMVTLGSICARFMYLTIEDLILVSLIPAVVPVIYLTALSFMPESPVYLCKCGDAPQARGSLQWLRGPTCDIDDEMNAIKKQTAFANSHWTWQTCWGILVVMILTFFRWLCICLEIVTLKFSFLSVSGAQYIDHIMASQILILGSLCISALLVDRIDRTKLLQTSYLLMAICLAVACTGSTLLPSSIFAFSAIFFAGVLWLTIILMLDVLDDGRHKAKAISTCLSFCWLLSVFTISDDTFTNMETTREIVMVLLPSICMCILAFCFTKYAVAKVIQSKNKISSETCDTGEEV